jgi:hypothetical protein
MIIGSRKTALAKIKSNPALKGPPTVDAMPVDPSDRLRWEHDCDRP